jgi:hypothetical protein
MGGCAMRKALIMICVFSTLLSASCNITPSSLNDKKKQIDYINDDKNGDIKNQIEIFKKNFENNKGKYSKKEKESYCQMLWI